MDTLALVVGVAIVLGLVARLAVRRSPRYELPVRAVALVVTQLGIAVLLGRLAVVVLADGRDTLHLAVALLFGLIAVGAILVSAVLVWGLFCADSNEHEDLRRLATKGRRHRGRS